MVLLCLAQGMESAIHAHYFTASTLQEKSNGQREKGLRHPAWQTGETWGKRWMGSRLWQPLSLAITCSEIPLQCSHRLRTITAGCIHFSFTWGTNLPREAGLKDSLQLGIQRSECQALVPCPGSHPPCHSFPFLAALFSNSATRLCVQNVFAKSFCLHATFLPSPPSFREVQRDLSPPPPPTAEKKMCLAGLCLGEENLQDQRVLVLISVSFA